jgi:hypothetical protein
MSWDVSLYVTDCKTGLPLAGASCFTTSTPSSLLGATDSSGLVSFSVFADDLVEYGFVISCSGYSNVNYTASQVYSGLEPQTVCLPPVGYDGNNPPGQQGGTGPWPTISCGFVAVTIGTSHTAAMNRLRHLRDRVAAASPLAGRLIEVVYDDYFKVSPSIAAELQHDVISRNAALAVVVRPLLAWYTLAGAVAFERADPKTIDKAVQEVVDACPAYFGRRAIVDLLENIRTGEALSADKFPILRDFAPRLREAAKLRFASWAILDPLVRAWRSAAEPLEMVEEVAKWLSDAPIESLSVPSAPESLDKQLRVLAGFLNFSPTARRRLGERLTAAWPDKANVIGRAGFLA